MNIIIKFINHILTARNGIDYSLTKLLGITVAVEMMVKFWGLDSPDFQGFAIGVAAIMAALAGKYFVEEPERRVSEKEEVKDNASED